MAFQEEPTKIAVAIADISVQLFDADPTGEGSDTIRYSVQVEFNDGSIVVRTGNLKPHLTSGQKTKLAVFMEEIRTQAVDEFLPGTIY